MGFLSAPDSFSFGDAVTGVSVAMIALSAIFVALRFYTRIAITRHGLGWDDWLILAGMVATCGTAALLIAENRIDRSSRIASAGGDPDYRAVNAHDILYMKLSFISSVLYFTAASATKLGILLMYVRIFYLRDGFRAQVVAVSTLVVAYWVACTVAVLLTCRPLNYVWGPDNAYPSYCFNFNLFWMASGVCEIVLDLLILALPLRVVMSIKLSPRRKISVMGVFLLGGFVIITGLIKVLLAFNPNGHIPFAGPAEVCSILHAGLATVCACLPVLKSLVARCTGAASAERSTSGYPRRLSAPDGWNIIDLGVRNSFSDSSVFSKTLDPAISVADMKV